MASNSAASLLVAAGLLGLAAPCRAGGWQATAEDVETSLIGELAGILRSGGPHRLEPALRPVYDAAPKDALGNLEPEAALSALGRAFTERAGWSVKGLEAGGAPGFSAPARLQQLLAERMGGQGFGLRELAVLAGSLEDLARKEGEARLTQAYDALGLPLAGRSERAQVLRALRAHAEAYAGGASPELLGRLEAEGRTAGGQRDGTLSLQEASRAALAMERQIARRKAQECGAAEPAAASASSCLEVSSLYSLCCHGGEEPPLWATALAEFPRLWALSAACLLLSALVAAGGRLCAAAAAGPGEASAEASAEDEGGKAPTAEAAAAQEEPAPAPRSGLLGSCVALCLLGAAAVAADLLDAAVLAPALGGGLALLAAARAALRRPAGAKKA